MRPVVFILLALILANIAGWYYFSASEKDRRELILYGNVDVRQVDIGFRVAGKVENLFFEEGDRVRQGKLMAALDKTPYISQVKQAEANVEALQANLDNAETLFRRRKELVGIGAVSQEDFDNARSNRDQLLANLDAAKASLAVSRDNLSYTEAYAPTDGVILTRIREGGTVVRESDPVYTLSVSTPVWIRAYVDEPHLGLIYYGMPADVITDTPGGKIYSGKIGFISPISEFTPKTVETTELRTDLVYRLRVYVDDPDEFLKQGMPVTIKLKLEKM